MNREKSKNNFFVLKSNFLFDIATTKYKKHAKKTY